MLILTDTQRDAGYLETVVKRLGLEPDRRGRSPGGNGNGSPKGYDAVVLNNVPRARVRPRSQSALVQLRRATAARSR